jgi:Flp pilus assembly protein TadD
MPPWLPERGYGEFMNERRLEDEEIETIQRWVDEGASEGDPADKPPMPEWVDGWQLGEPDLVLRMPNAYTLRADGSDVFRNFVIPIQLPSTRYVRAMEFRPDRPNVVHHAVIGVDRRRFSRVFEREDPEPGFDGMPSEQVETLFGWTPGKAPFRESEDMARPVEQGSDLVLQLHMLPTGKPETIQPSVGVFFTSTAPTRVPFLLKLGKKVIDIPVGQKEYTVDDTYVLPVDVDAFSVYPHAHYLAKDMKAFAVLPDGSRKWLVWIKAWDFKWQDQYRYVTPLFLPKGTSLTMSFTYDNSSDNPRNPNRPPRRVKWGPGSLDEMGDLWLQVVPRTASDIDVLRGDFVERELQADIAGAERALQADPLDGEMHNFLGTRYLLAGRTPDAIEHFEQGLRLKPDDAEAHNILGSVLQSQGRLAEAIGHLREASRLRPRDDRVQFNLGNALGAAGKVREAIDHFRRAIALNPGDADAHHNLALMLRSQNQLGEAISHLRRALEIAPRSADIHNNLGAILALNGQVDEALFHVREALNVQPDFPDAQNNLSLLLKLTQSSPSQR